MSDKHSPGGTIPAPVKLVLDWSKVNVAKMSDAELAAFGKELASGLNIVMGTLAFNMSAKNKNENKNEQLSEPPQPPRTAT